MTTALFIIGVLSAGILLPLMARTLLDRRFRLWPTPAPGSWQSQVFWLTFRTLNVTALATATLAGPTLFGLADEIRLTGLVLLVVFAVLYGYSLFALGKRNTYCNRDGLVTDGIYRWTRNPQYATIIPLYVALAVAVDTANTYVLAGALVAVFVLMALAEEPWLAAAYGEDYRAYCRRVPRFFNWRRAATFGFAVARQGYRYGQRAAGRLAPRPGGPPFG